MNHLLSLNDLSGKEITDIISLAQTIKKSPKKYSKALFEKTIVLMFDKPSLRTRLSFEMAMTQLGGHAIYYGVNESPLAIGKESLYDTAKVISRMANGIVIRTFSHDRLLEFAASADAPVINALTDFEHPCQIIGDLLTIKEKKKTLQPSVAYYGDCHTNVCHSWMFAAKKLNFSLFLVGPDKKAYQPSEQVFSLTKSNVTLLSDPKKVPPTDIVYTDSWMSYQIPKDEQEKRVKDFGLYTVTKQVMNQAKKDALFMHDLPAIRGMEVEEGVIDGKQSIVFEEAENRLHSEKAILVWLMQKALKARKK